MIGADTRVGWWRYLAAKFGYDDSQIRPYRRSEEQSSPNGESAPDRTTQPAADHPG